MKFYKRDFRTEVQSKDIESIINKNINSIDLDDIIFLISKGIYCHMNYVEKGKYTHTLNSWWVRDTFNNGILVGVGSWDNIPALREQGNKINNEYSDEEICMQGW